MSKTTYKVTTAEGNVETRKSDRPYTHVLLGRKDYVALRAHFNKDHGKDDLYRSNFRYYTKLAARSVDSTEWSQYDSTEEREREIAKAKEAIAGFANAEEYRTVKTAAAIARECPEGQDQGEEVALRWSMKAASARGAISEFQSRLYTAFRIVEAEAVTKTTNRAGANPGNKESNMNTAATTTETKPTTKKKAAAKKASKPAKKATKKVAPKTAKKVATKKAAAKSSLPGDATTRKGTIIALIQRTGGATLAEIMAATDWQAHSVRGTISTLGKTMKIDSGKSENGERTYIAAV